MKINIFWFRRDLRFTDNTALMEALSSGLPVLPLFIFDTSITNKLPASDPRIGFIYDTLHSLNRDLNNYSSSLLIKKGDPLDVWNEIAGSLKPETVFTNRDYEPYAVKRDESVKKILQSFNIRFADFKDQVIFEKTEVVKPDNSPYTVFTPYKKRWLQHFETSKVVTATGVILFDNFHKEIFRFPSITELGFIKSSVKVRPYDLSVIRTYDRLRDIPSADATSYLGPHLRFGTVSIRLLVKQAYEENSTFLGELIWREFFMQILTNYPRVEAENFRRKYNGIRWRNNEKEFQRWCNGETGYPLVDAGMRQLAETGYMHNRIRMITAGFLCKHLLIDWRWGEALFAQRLLDYELSSNNGNWQWSAGTGCDAAPYFRVFNPLTQQDRFDPRGDYIHRWVPGSG
ncbi:MAG TPA: deoxyribodipyrimidine photo-lyase, partial [Bacteroidales bacterium]|nr:deoxyribodipyrimidine photo-lyase [Bacteroidales bacterium]